jgi:hypothetical protein
MNAFPWHHPDRLATCMCTWCKLVRCGVIDDDEQDRREIEFAGEARVAMMRLVGQEPLLWWGPRCRWEGVLDWFRVLGQALDFDDAEGDDDDPLA